MTEFRIGDRVEAHVLDEESLRVDVDLNGIVNYDKAGFPMRWVKGSIEAILGTRYEVHYDSFWITYCNPEDLRHLSDW